MNRIPFWKRSVSLARLYRFSTDSNSGDGKRLILLWVLAYHLIINDSTRQNFAVELLTFAAVYLVPMSAGEFRLCVL